MRISRVKGIVCSPKALLKSMVSILLVVVVVVPNRLEEAAVGRDDGAEGAVEGAHGGGPGCGGLLLVMIRGGLAAARGGVGGEIHWVQAHEAPLVQDGQGAFEHVAMHGEARPTVAPRHLVIDAADGHDVIEGDLARLGD